MGIVDEAVEDGVGIGRIADHRVPVLDGKLTGDDGRSAAVAFFEDQEVVACGGIERFLDFRERNPTRHTLPNTAPRVVPNASAIS